MHFPDLPNGAELFTDIDDKWYAHNINALALHGAYIATHGEARGDAALTREEAAAMIFNSFPLKLFRYPKRFTDNDRSMHIPC